MKIRVPVKWVMEAEVVVHADSIEEALDLIHDMPIPDYGEYVDDSFEILKDEITIER